MNRTASSFFTCLFLVTAAMPAYAQDDTPDTGAAHLEVKLSQLEEQIRRMEGALEQLSYENKQLKGQLDKSNADTQYRLQALESKGAPAAVAPVAAGTPPAADNGDIPPTQSANDTPPADNGTYSPVAPAAAAPQKFASPRDHYNYAFRLMNQAKYNEAGESFSAFAHQYPHDPLVGNAFYWLGETYYVRRDYVQAADNFRQGYEAMPAGPKAADNLLKLAMSLDAMKKDPEACVVLKQITTKYENAGSVKPRAEQEINRIGCN